MKPWTLLAGLSAFALTTPAAAQDGDPFAQAVAESLLAIEQADDGRLSGEGLERLMDEGRASQFFLIGEQHAAHEIALAEIDLHRRLAPEGYNYMVVELGPLSTFVAEDLIRSGDDALRGYIQTPGQQFVFPFIFMEEELALAEQGVALSSRDNYALWGVDQEFLGAGPVLAPLLTAGATTDEQVAAAQAFADGVAGNPMYLGVAPDADIAALKAAFADAPDGMRRMVDGIALTHRVYGPFMRSSGTVYEANLERENFMKANFIAHFNAAEEQDGEPPRAFFKFGGYHMERGLSGTDVPALGNFVIEWGRARDFGAVNVMIDCFGGQTYGIMQGGAVACENYYLEEGSPMFEAMGDAEAGLFDLRSLRPMLRRAGDIDPRLRDLILSFDYYLVIRDVTPQTPVADLTLPDM